MARKLRIVFSAVCAIVCLVLIVLWVRSYWWHDIASFGFTPRQAIRFDSTCGGVAFLYIDWGNSSFNDLKVGLNTLSLRKPEVQFLPLSGREDATAGFLLQPLTDGVNCAVPYWYLLTLTWLCGVAPWFSIRFSLRTLLLVTTVVTVLLGAIVYATR